MDESSTMVNSQTVYELTKKLRALQAKERELEKRQNYINTQKLLTQINDLKTKNDTMITEITSSCEVISKMIDKPEKVIYREDNYISLPLHSHKHFKQIFAKSSEILKQSLLQRKTNSADVNVDLTTTLENNNRLTGNLQRVGNSLEKCAQLVTVVNNINKEKKSSLQIQDVHMPRKRRSFLSDSLFVQTFEDNNISTSSQYEEKS